MKKPVAKKSNKKKSRQDVLDLDKSHPNDQAVKRVFIDVPGDLHNRVKVHCAKKGMSMRKWLQSLITTNLDNNS